MVSSIFFSLFKSPSFLSSFSNLLLKTFRNEEYSNLACSTTPGLYPKSLLVHYSYLCSSVDDNVETLAASLILSLICFNLVIKNFRFISKRHFYEEPKIFFLNLRGSLAGNVKVKSINSQNRVWFSYTIFVNFYKIFIMNG